MARDLTGGQGPTTDGKSPFSAAPAGLRQQGSARDLTGGAQSPWLKPGWQTGGQTGTTANAFNDDFYTRMYDQYEEEQKKIETDKGYVSNLFLRDDYTGIVGWNQTFTKDNPVFGDQLEKDRSFRVGDIYDNGKYLGNVYDQQSGMTIEEANAMVAPHIFGSKAADKYKEANGDQQKLKELIQDQGEREGQNVEAYVTRAPYQNSVESLLEDWDNSFFDELAITAAGVAGGAVAGLPFGIPGLIGGAIVGGVGSWMNQDEARVQAAQASVSTGLIAEQEGIDAAIAHATSQWSGLAGTRLNVTSNLLGGIVDAPKIGDNVSEIRQAAANGNVGAIIGTGITGFVDGMLMTASPVGRAVYAGTMGASVLGDAYVKATRYGQWDEVTGSFHRYENMGEALSGAGATLIDAVQSITPWMLARSNALGIGGVKSNTLDDMAEDGATGVRTVMDRSFQIENRGGAIVATQESKVQNVLGWLAPSTITNRLTVRGLAQKKALDEGRVSVTADDLYQVATRIEQSSVPWKLALVNGFGEAQEEVLQTFLNANAVGWQAEPQEYLQAAVAGFAMGAGMTFGTRVDTRSQDIAMRTRANGIMVALKEKPFSEQEWKGMTREQKIAVSTAPKNIQATINAKLKHTMQDVERQVVSSDQALGAHEDAVREKLKGVLTLDGDPFEKMAEILPFENVMIPSHQIRYSAQSAVQLLEDRAAALQAIPEAQGTRELLENMLATYVRPMMEEYRQSGNTDALDAINTVIQDMWNGTVEERQAVELVFSRMPNDNPGSFQMLLLQIDPTMTINGIHGSAKISQAYNKLLSHDNDGDKIKHMARYVPNETARKIMRVGIHHWATGNMVGKKVMGLPFGGSGFLNIADRAYENGILTLISDLRSNKVTTEIEHLDLALDKIASDLTLALDPAVPSSVFESFRRNLDKNPLGAKAELYRELGKYQSQLFDLGQVGNNRTDELAIGVETSIGIWIDDYLQRAYEEWRRAYAFRQVPAPTKRDQEGVAAEPTALAADVVTKGGLRAATLGQTLAQRQGATAPLRTRGFLAYGAINASNLDADGYQDSDLIRQQLIEWYTTLTRLRAGSKLDEIRTMGNPVATAARVDLQNLAQAYAPEEYQADPWGTMFEMANMPFWQLSEKSVLGGDIDMNKHSIDKGTIAQALVRAAAEREKASVPSAAGELDAVQIFSNVKPARAMQLILGDMPMASVLDNREASRMGIHHTLDSAIKSYTQLASRRKRQEWRDERKGSYSESFRKIVDTVRLAVDTELAHGDLATGEATGELAKSDREFHSDVVVRTFESVHQIVRRVVGREVITPADLISNLENRTRVVEMVLKMLPADMRIKIIGRGGVPTDPNSVALPGWFFDMLLEPNAEKATMIYWNAMLESELDTVRSKGEDAPATHRNTWVDLWLSLDEAGRRTFDDARESSTDVLSFVNLVNRQFAYERPPMLAWRTDTSMFDPSVTRSGWQWAAPSAETRQAIRDANKYVTKRLGSLELDQKLEQNNLRVAQRMLNSIVKPDKKTTNAAKQQVQALDRLLQQAQTFNKEAVGPQSIRTYLQFAYRGIDPESAAKGKPSPSTAAIGDTDSRRDQVGFSDPLRTAMAAVTAVDLDDLVYTPQRLREPLRITTRTGQEINWNPLSAQSWLELFVADEGAYQGMLWDLILPIVYDGNMMGSSVASHLLPKDLQGAVEGNLYNRLLTEDSPESNELLIAYVNSLTPDNELLKAIARTAIARTTGERARPEMSKDDYSRLIKDVAKAIRAMAGLVEAEDLESGASRRTRLTEALETIETAALMQYVQTANLPNLESAALLQTGESRAEALAIVATAREKEVKSARAVYADDPSTENMILLVDAVQDHSRALALVHASSIGEISFATFKIDWGTEAQQISQTAIAKYLNTFSPTLETMSTEKDAEALTRYMITPDNGAVKDFGPDNEDIWNRLADIVSIHNTLRRRGELAAGFIAMPDSGEVDLMDPTFSFLAKPFLGENVLNAVVKMREAAPAGVIPAIEASRFNTIFSQTVMNTKGLTWSPEIVTQILNADTYLGSSGSKMQVSKGGLKPQNQLAADIAATRTYTFPPAEDARTYSIPLQDLVESRKNIYETGLDGDMWALMQGASVVVEDGTGPVLRVYDAAGQEVQQHGLNFALDNIVGSTKEKGSTYDIKSLNYSKLVERAAHEFNKVKQQGWTATVDFRMFHPADKPADPKWANNVHYDGVAGAADTARSAYSAANQGVAGQTQDLQRAALDSSKGGVTALFGTEQSRRFDTRDPNKLGELIQQMAADIMGTQITADSYIPDSHFRLYYRMIRDRMVIAGEDAEGNTVYLSTEQALTEGLGDLIDPRVAVLSEKSLETLRGSTSGSGHPRILERAPMVGGEGETWTGLFTPEQLQRLPELGKTAEGLTEVADALRSSGILSNERITTYAYKDYAYNAQRIGHRPYSSFDSTRERIKLARLDNARVYERDQETNNEVGTALAQTLLTTLRADEAVVGQLISALGGVSPDSDTNISTGAATRTTLIEDMNTNAGRIWRLNPSNLGNKDQGYITSLRDASGSDSNQFRPVDDTVWFELQGFEGFEDQQWENAVRDEIQAASELGLKVIFTHTSSPGAVKTAEGLLAETNTLYALPRTGLPMMLPLEENQMQQTVRAREASFGQGRRIPLRNTVLDMLDDSGSIVSDDEGALFDPRSNFLVTGTAVHGSVVPTNLFAQYTSPGTPEAGDRMETVLSKLRTPEGIQYLTEQTLRGRGQDPTTESPEISAEIRQLLDRAALNLDPATGRPKIGADFQVGDPYFVIKNGRASSGALALVRWGHDAEGIDFGSQDSSAFEGATREGIFSTGSIRFVNSEKISQDIASVRGGQVEEIQWHPTFGLSMVFTTPITMESAKIIDQGKKTRMVTMDERDRPTTPLYRDVFAFRYINGKGERSKGATRGVGLNAATAISIHGWDAGRTLANALSFTGGHPNPNASYWTRQEWADASDSVRAGVMAQVRGVLETQRSTSATRYSSPAEAARAITMGDPISETARMLHEQQKGMSLGGAQLYAAAGAEDLTARDAELQYLSAVLTYLNYDGAAVSEVFGAPGIQRAPGQVDGYTYEMPAALSEFIDTNLEVRRYIQADMNSRMVNNQIDNEGNLVEGWYIREDWRLEQRNADGLSRLFTPRLSSTAMATGEDDPETSVMSAENSTRDTASNQSQSLAMQTLRLDLGHGIRDAKLDKMLRDAHYVNDSRRRMPYGSRMGASQGKTLDAQQREAEADFRIRGGWEPLSPIEAYSTAQERNEVANGYKFVYDILGLTADGTHKRIVDMMIRTFFRAWHDPENPGVAELSAKETTYALQKILSSLNDGKWPFVGGRAPAVHADVVAVIANEGTWSPDNKPVRQNRLKELLTSSLESMMAATEHITPDAQLEMDGLLNTYEKYLSDGVWPVSHFPDVIKELLDKDGDKFVSSIDPNTQLRLERGNPYTDYDKTAVGEAGIYNPTAEAGTKSEIARRNRQDIMRGRTSGGLERQTTAQIRKRGRILRSEVRTTNDFWANAHALRTIMPQLNPMLWIWNPVDKAYRRMPATAASLVSGGSIGLFGRGIRKTVNSVAKAFDKQLEGLDPESKRTKMLELIQNGLGIENTYIDPVAQSKLKDTIDRLVNDPTWRATIFGETRHRPDYGLMSRTDVTRQRLVDNVSKLQDIGYGLKPTHEAQMYITWVLEHERVVNPQVEAIDVLLNLINDPLYYEKQGPRGAHNQAIRNIQNTMGAKLTTIGVAADKILLPAASSSNWFVGNTANALLLMMKYRNFALSSIVNATGSQGLDAAASIMMQTLSFRKAYVAQQKGINDVKVTDYVGQVMESADIADLFIRSGLSHTGLFMAALALGSMGLTGEDEEERRRRRIEKLQGLGRLYDPRDIVNDFRNRDAVWLEGLATNPLGAMLAQHFAVPTAEGEERRSPTQLHWTLNFFVAPALGMADFLQTGDFYDIVHGFESAIGQMPLVNTNMWWDAVSTAETMYSAATDDVVETGGSTDGMAFLIKVVSVLEKALLENAFINELYAASTAHAVNAWGKVETAQDGTIVRDRDGVPELTEATDTKIDDNPQSPTFGTVIDRRQTEDYYTGLIKNFTSTNATAAFLATLFTGLQFNKGGSFMRSDMAASQTTLERTGISDEDGAALIMSIFNEKENKEVLTELGAERLVDSLHAGTIRASDPAFQNIFLTGDQRAAISDTIQSKLYMEGVEVLGLSEEDATQRMWELWNGNAYTVALSDVVWSQNEFAGDNGIPWKQTVTYTQLNTTWVQGPDGKMWATGVPRSTMVAPGIVSPLGTYYGAAGANNVSNLGVDELLNSTDPMASLNTGFRGLTRKDESLSIPDEQDILDEIKASTDRVIDAIKDMRSDLYNDDKYRTGYRYGGGYGRRGGGGGGGGGGRSYANNPLMPFLNGMRAQYADNIPQIYINNINPRRATLRRERFSSERGRLNQWQ